MNFIRTLRALWKYRLASRGKSPGGRPRIGYKGIGFLAVARYCGALQRRDSRHPSFRGTELLQRRNRKTFPLEEIIGDIVPPELLNGRFDT